MVNPDTIDVDCVNTRITWVSLDSFYKTIEELRKRALSGERLRNLDDVVSKLKDKRD